MHPFWFSLSVFGLFLTVEGIASWVFIRRSRRLYPELWEHAGSPTLLGDGDLISAWPTNRYLLRRQYLQLDDATARNFAEKLRLPMLIGYFGSWAAVAGVLVSLLVFGKP